MDNESLWEGKKVSLGKEKTGVYTIRVKVDVDVGVLY